MKIECVLCPTDLSSASDEALRYAVSICRAYGAELLLLHCDTNKSIQGVSNEHDAEAEILREALARYCGSADLAGLEWKSLVTTCDDAGEAIVRAAAIYGVDLIVMRSRRRPYRAALLGSTAESVSRTAPCPVLVMHNDDREWENETEPVEMKRILVAYDFSDYSELALKYALSIAQEHQAELHLLNVLPPSTINETELSWYPIGTENAYHKAAQRLQRAVPAEAHLWCRVKHVVSEGPPYREILNYAEKNKIDLICLGAHGAGFGMKTLFGSNVDRVLRQASCPVLVTRPLKPAHVQTHELDREMDTDNGRQVNAKELVFR
ncbi:MAG TPA: universal stress protein [Pyrinomonadaceae bacterium]|nr:universal stress protein [Pyrinomonadaceae bacterium]